MTTKYCITRCRGGKWVITDIGHDYLNPTPTHNSTFAFDTETLTYYDGKVLSNDELKDQIAVLTARCKKAKKSVNDVLRKKVSIKVWAWQCYDEVNGFFMTNDFYRWLRYQCRCQYGFGWCYNATFDFSNIDYKILGENKKGWVSHEHVQGGKSKAQPYTYESLHNDMGARYAYKLWIPYKDKQRHKHTHSVEYHDFMKLCGGGLDRVLADLGVTDNEGNEIRKLKMDYQEVDINNPSDDNIDYCKVDVKGLYFGIKKFNEVVNQVSNNELSIFGNDTNVMTAGGMAKHCLLQSLYPDISDKRKRLQMYQKSHPINAELDKWFRDNHLYRGGISFVNERYRGKLLRSKNFKGRKMGRWDVNSEYPYSMTKIRTLIGKPHKMPYSKWLGTSLAYKDEHECIYMVKSASGHVKRNSLGFWYDPFQKKYVDDIDEEGLHLIFERELQVLSRFYDDLTIDVDEVIVFKKGDYIYKPFIDKNYSLKSSASKQGNNTLKMAVKLLLNSSYGKLAERLQRVKGHYELNDLTGAIHFIRDDVEISEKSAMSVVDGSLVTSYARCYILCNILEICGDEPAKTFIYIDTDSIHAFADYDQSEKYALGGLKLEMTCEAVKYILPKTYIDIAKVDDNGFVDYDDFELHAKGVNLKVIKNDIREATIKKYGDIGKKLTNISILDRFMNFGVKFTCLQSMNVKGGKALLPVAKYLARLEQSPHDDDKLVINNYDGVIFSEI